MEILRKFLIILTNISLGLTGCALTGIPFPTSSIFSHSINQPISFSKRDCNFFSYQFPMNADLPANSGLEDDVVVIMSISGGGKRASAFGYGVMIGLQNFTFQTQYGRQTNLLNEVDKIAGVSGGSVPALFYAARRNPNDGKIDAMEEFQAFLDANTEFDLLVRSFFPLNWFKSNSQILAEYFNELFLYRTFSELPSKPQVLISATNFSDGSRFDFKQDEFQKIGSDLCRFPLGYAIASSAAYPIFFSPIPLENFNPALPRELGSKDVVPKFIPTVIHLSDGGLIDNYATRVFLEYLANGILLNDPLDKESPKKAKGIVFIRVNASHPLSPYNSGYLPGFKERIERSFNITGERQIQDSNYLVIKEFVKRTCRSNVVYIPLKISLSDETLFNKIFQDSDREKLKTGWTLDSRLIAKLIEAGNLGITQALEDNENGEEIKNLFDEDSNEKIYCGPAQ